MSIVSENTPQAREGTTAPRPSDHRYVLTLSCPDRLGLVARISRFLADAGGSIVEAGYHSDRDEQWFFTRQVVSADTIECDVTELRARFAEVAAEFGERTTWRVSDSTVPKRAVLLVTREPHCLHDLLGRVTNNELSMDIAAVVGNHTALGGLVEAHGIPFHHVPFPGAGAPDRERARAAAFASVRGLVDGHDPDIVVLARFMQVLPDELCRAWSGRAINIHHSFLPSFAGARPYHQAFQRGVKLIGATCHFVTADLDAGPIIEQEVARIDHSDTVPDLVRRGRDVERVVLARGLRWFTEDRVLVHGNKTVIFR